MSSIVADEIYQIQIKRAGIELIANAGAKLSIQVNNQWVNVLQAMGLSMDGSGGAVSNIINGFQILSGNNFLPKIATSHAWRGSNGLEISLALRFDAWDDARADVLRPVQQIVRMFMPTRPGGEAGAAGGVYNTLQSLMGGNFSAIQNTFLQPPGPTPWQVLFNTSEAARQMVNLRVGKVWILTDLIPTNFTLEFEDRYTKQGDPVCAMVNVGFQSFQTPTADDVIGYFRAGPQGPASAPSSGGAPS